jgi:hypothetical protein
MIAASSLLQRLSSVVPEVVTGPLRFDAQYWVATGKPSHVSPGHPELSEARFADAVSAEVEVSTKPFGVGLFTSTGVLGGHGMWRTYLDLNEGSSLFPPPWHTWAVEAHPDAVVREIASARQWVDFVRSYPLRDGVLTYPNWRSVARDYDGVHMTLLAIAATQGLYFPVGQEITAPPYWDVESTLWLHWRFRSVVRCDVTC